MSTIHWIAVGKEQMYVKLRNVVAIAGDLDVSRLNPRVQQRDA